MTDNYIQINLNKFYELRHDVLTINNDINNKISNNLKIIFDFYPSIKEIINHIHKLTAGMPVEVLTNINYHSIIWEYLNAKRTGMTNSLYNEFKKILFDKIEIECSSKLNTLMHFNDLIYITLIEYNKLLKAQLVRQ